jgi:hypothetical protein
MNTDQKMTIQIGKNYTVQIGHLSQVGKLNDVLEIGNKYRKEKGLREIEMREWLVKESTWEFIIKVFNEETKKSNSQIASLDIASTIATLPRDLSNRIAFGEILKKKVENIQSQTLEVFRDIQKTVSVPERISRRSLERKIEDEAKTTIRKRLEDNLNQIKVDLKDEFLKNRYFSNGLTEKVPSYFSEIDMSFIEKHIPKYEDNFDSINRKIREDYLHNQFLEDFSNLVKEIVDDKADEVKDRVFIAFASAIGNSSEVEKMAEKVFVFEQQSGKFDYLFERFGRKMLDLIIYNPVMGSKREEDYKTYKDELLYLDSRYKNDGRILNMVISGKDEALSTGSGLEIFKNDFFNALKKLPESRTEFVSICETDLFEQLENLGKEENSYDDKELFGNRKGNYSREDVLEEINRDIRNFKTVLIEAVIPILDLESVFIKRVEKEIFVMISKLDSPEINDFVLNSLDIYLEKELANIDEVVADYTRRKEILDKIEEFLKNPHNK